MRWRGPVEESDQLAHRVVAVLWMAEGELVVNLVAVTTAGSGPGQVAGLLELADDVGCGALGDPDLDGDVPEAERRVGSDALEDVRVIRYESKRMIAIS